MTNLISRYSTRLLAFVFGLSTIVPLSCSSNPLKTELVMQLLQNNDVEMGSEVPSSWYCYSTAPEDTVYNCLWTDEETNSPSRSLMVELAPEHGVRDGAWWVQSVDIEPNKYTGMDLELKAATMLKNVFGRIVYGRGASIKIVAYKASGTMQQIATLEDDSSMFGTRYWKESSLILKNLSNRAQRISVYVGLGRGANGTVYFDDITLSVFK